MPRTTRLILAPRMSDDQIVALDNQTIAEDLLTKQGPLSLTDRQT